MHRNVLYALLFINVTTATLLQDNDAKTYVSLRKYLDLLNEKTIKSNYFAVLNSLPATCNEITKIFYDVARYKPLVIFADVSKTDKLLDSNNIPSLTKKLAETEVVYVFLENFTSLNETLNTIRKLSKIISYSGYFQFVYCEKLQEEATNVKNLFKSVWKELILNAYFVYYDKNDILNVLTYNPFTDQVFSDTNVSDVATWKSNCHLKNLRGYQLRIAICNDYPRNIYENNETYGQDLSLLKEIVKTMNATIKYIYHDSCKSIRNDIEHGVADFSFIGHFITDNLNVKYTYPISMDDVIILAPLAGTIPIYLNIFLVFGPLAWFCYFVLGITLIVLLRFIEKYKGNRKMTLSDVIFAILTISFNNPMTKLTKKTAAIKFLLIAWSTNCFLYNSLFTSSMTSVYVKPNKIMHLRFLQELDEANLDVYVPEDFEKIIPEDNILSDQIFFDTRESIVAYINEGHLNAAFALPASIIWNLYHNKLSKSKINYGSGMTRLINRPKYVPLFDRLIPGHKVYLFPNKTPYLSEINYYLRIDTENALSKQMPLPGVRGGRGRYKFREGNKYTAFTLTHLQVFFYLYFIGIGLAIVVFVVEHLRYNSKWFWMKLNRSFTN